MGGLVLAHRQRLAEILRLPHDEPPIADQAGILKDPVKRQRNSGPGHCRSCSCFSRKRVCHQFRSEISDSRIATGKAPQKICEFLQDMPQFSPAASLSGHATMKTMDNSRTAGLSSNVPR